MSTSKTIIGLDLGTKCGYAVLKGRKRLESAAVKLQPTKARMLHRAERWKNFGNLLHTLYATWGPDCVFVYEMVRRHMGADAAHVYGGWLTKLEEFDFQLQLIGAPTVFERIEVSTWKKATTGNGRASKDLVLKTMSKRFKIKIKTEDEADALGVAEAYRLIQAGKYKP